jgi:hypothetical protein
MQIKKSILIISDSANNLNILLAALANLEYKPDLQVDLIIKEVYSEIEIRKLINCIVYLLQINYSYHSFNIFVSDKDLLKAFKSSLEIQTSKRDIKISSLLGLMNYDIVDSKGKLTNNHGYSEILNLRNDRIETFYDIQNLNIEVKAYGNGSI